MNDVLFLAHTDAGGGLPRAALETLTAAKDLAGALGAKLDVALFGEGVQAAAGATAGAGARRLLVAAGPELSQPRYGSDAAAAAALARASGAGIVVAPHTSRLARVMAGVAVRLGGRIDTHVTGLAGEGGALATRWFYRQRIEGKVRRKERPWILLVDPGTAAAHAGSGAAPAAEPVRVSVTDADQRTTVTGTKQPGSGKSTIRPDAKLLFVAGAGWTKKQPDGAPHPDVAEKLILEFIDAAGASLGSSKSLVDQAGEGQKTFEFMSHLNQVGQTGATPRHPKGLATCCHGEEPHVVGWRFVGQRRAVNLDAGCGWARGKADVLYVADAFAVMAKVNELLAAKK